MRRARVYLVLILALMLFTAACSAQTAGGEFPQSTLDILDTATTFIPKVSLPAVEVTYDPQGVPSVLGFSTQDIRRLTGINLSFLELDPLFIEWFERTNLQHVEIENTENGLFLYANGNLLPSIAWNDESLANAVEVARMFGVQNTTVVQRLIPILQRLGIDLVLRFPVDSANPRIPLSQGVAELPTPSGPEQPSAVIQLVVEYREDGVPTVMGLTTRNITALTGANLSFLEFSENRVASLKQVNLQNIEVETQPDGLHVYVNGKELPRLAYSPQQLDALVNLYDQLEMYPTYQPSPSFLREALVLLQGADVDFAVQFPVAAAAKRLPLHGGDVTH